MYSATLAVFYLFRIVLATDYTLENCQLHSKNDNLIIDFYGKLETTWVDVSKYDSAVANSSWYLNFCPNSPHQCPLGSFLCLRVNSTILDIGSTFEGITEDWDGSRRGFRISLKGSHGRSTVIIYCDESEGPPILSGNLKQEGDSFHLDFILWRSVTNCPVQQFIAEDTCVLYADTRSFDLRPLYGTYNVSAIGRSFVFNLCEVVEGSPCPTYLCENVPSRGVSPLSHGYKLRYLQGKDLSIIFDTEDVSGKKKIIINLYCSREAAEKKLNFVSEHGDFLIFSMKTPFACLFPEMNCLIHDVGNVAYDLTPLHKPVDNYEIMINKKTKLIFNICGPLSFNKQFLCADGNKNYGCLVDENNRTISVATTFKSINVTKPGMLSLSYEGKGLFLNITLICAKNLSIYPNITNSYKITNRYDVLWETYTACPQKFSRGNNCLVKNLFRFNNLVNLTSLHKKQSDYYYTLVNSVNGNTSFRINVCGALNKSCSKNPNAAVCLIKSDSDEIAIGQAQEPQFVDGQFIFDLQGEPCRKGAAKSRVKIILACDFDVNSFQLPELFPSQKENECTFYFFWKTSLVCGSSAMTKCMYSDEDVSYDLSSLRNLRENYVVNYGDSQIELNICHTLIPGHKTHCTELSGACLKNNSIESIISNTYHGNNDENLGIISGNDNFEVIGNKLRMNYSNGGVCLTEGEGSPSSTTIDFFCDKKAYNSEPKLVSVKDCQYYFNWTTSAACPTFKRSRCTAMDPVSGTKFDLSSLMEEEVVVEGSNIVLGICRPVSHKGCPDNSGACVIKNTTIENIGYYNSHLIFNESLFLIYNGTNCKSTRIDFRCSDFKESKPILVKDNYCSKVVSWPTRLACINDHVVTPDCCKGIEEMCDQLNKTYEVHLNKTEKIFINVCKPLVPMKGIYCPPMSVSCMASHESFDVFHQEKSLGKALNPPIELNETSIVLEYVNGDICENDLNKHYSTSVTFVCDKNLTHGHPELVNVSGDCHFEFIWATSLMCKEKCALSEYEKDMHFLHNFLDWDEKVMRDGKESSYVLNICNVSKKCGSHICELSNSDKTWRAFSLTNRTETVRSTVEKIELFYSYSLNNTEGDCGAKVDLMCDEENRRPLLAEERECFIHIKWKSKWACVTENSSVVVSSNVGAWIVMVISLICLVAIVGLLVKLNSRMNLRDVLRTTFSCERVASRSELTELTADQEL